MSSPQPSLPPGGISKGAQIAIAALVVVGLVGAYGYARLGDEGGYRYFTTLTEFQSNPPAGKVRVHGFVAPGSIERDIAGKAVRFSVQNDPPHQTGAQSNVIEVSYATLELPDLFKDGAEVIVEGALEGSGAGAVFHATNVLAKCPSKFQARQQESAAR
jgi:cytochrome c-type biogenesis protein CcmE